MNRHPYRLQRSIGAVLTIAGSAILAVIDYGPGVLGILTANPPLLILGLALAGICLGIAIETFW